MHGLSLALAAQLCTCTAVPPITGAAGANQASWTPSVVLGRSRVNHIEKNYLVTPLDEIVLVPWPLGVAASSRPDEASCGRSCACSGRWGNERQACIASRTIASAWDVSGQCQKMHMFSQMQFLGLCTMYFCFSYLRFEFADTAFVAL